MLRVAILILSGNISSALLNLARSLLVARLIPVADFGIASTLVLAVTIIEMATAVGMGVQVVQSKEGGDPRFLAAVQGFQVLRGLVIAVLVFAVAGPIANFLNVPEAAWGYRMMALVPLLGAMAHMDVYRLNREMVFGPSLVTSLVPIVAALIALWPLSVAFGDWRIMLGSVLVQSVVGVLASHLVARRPYRLALDRGRMAETMRFGWPIMINGWLLFLTFNGDRMLVGREMGMETLAIFTMGVTLTLTPTLVLTRATSGYFLPLLSRVDRGSPEGVARFAHLSLVALEVALLNGVLMLLGVVLVGEQVVQLLLGERYAPLLAFLTGLAAVHAVRVFKSSAAVVALSIGQTTNDMYGNGVRALSLPIAWAVLLAGGGIDAIILVAFVAEIGGYAVSLWLVRSRVGLDLRPLRLPIAATAAFVAATLVPGLPVWAGSTVAILLALAALASMADLRRYALRRYWPSR